MTRPVSEPIHFRCGHQSKNRFMLAPMTNTQSHEDGRLSEDEYQWLTMRALGGFGITMTCASHVQKMGKGFPGQLGIFSDHLISDHQRLASGIRKHGSLAVIQLHHAGMRSPEKLIGDQPLCPSDNQKHHARGLSLHEVHQLREDFIAAAERAKISGYDGVEIHGAHGYILAQFLSSKINQRTDDYGGSLENRSRLLFEIVRKIREKCGPGFLLGVRLSPERFGMSLSEIKIVAQRLMDEQKTDFLDISLWDFNKLPEEENHRHQRLLEHFTCMERGGTQLTVAGQIRSGRDVRTVMDADVDFVSIGRSAILHHDFPNQVMKNPHFEPTKTPVSPDYLQHQGLSDTFIQYMRRWPDFVKEAN